MFLFNEDTQPLSMRMGLWSAPQGKAYSVFRSSALQPSEGINNNNKFPISSHFYKEGGFFFFFLERIIAVSMQKTTCLLLINHLQSRRLT